jgi:two-component system, NtrC family, response regulator
LARVLIVDDDEIMSAMLTEMVSRAGHDASKAPTLQEAFNKILDNEFDVVFLDIRLPDGNGLDALPLIRKAPSQPEIIIITGFGDPDGAELAMRNEAWDYLKKPSSVKEMTLALTRAIQYRDEKRSHKPPLVLKREGIIGGSSQMDAVMNLLAQAAGNEANVLITGATGTGKELFAWAIHNNSRRAGKNFVVVDCTALPETLVESILFGHEKGAFTGADKMRDGLVRQAHGGTLFLDEVGELPLAMQKSFLRVLQDHSFRPIGGKDIIESNFRLIAATNRDLSQMTAEGRFREDLLFRIRTLHIDLPPLRDRLADIEELTKYYIAKFCTRYGIAQKGFSPEFLEALKSYEWPGNVRELVNSLERALSTSFHEPTLFPKHLPTDLRVYLAKGSMGKDGYGSSNTSKDRRPAPSLPNMKDFRDTAISEAEQRYLTELKAITGRNISEACRISGLSRPRLYALLKRYGLTKQG